MTDRAAGKTIFITAAGQGIGRATAALFLAEGARVIATDINPGLLEGLDGCERRGLDVTDAAAVAAAAAETGAIDVLFNCAGIVDHGTILDNAEDVWRRAFDVNVLSMVRTIKAFLPSMLKRGSGSIINVASVASSLKGLPDRCAYGTTKAAVIGLTKSVARDYVDKGIRCNAICPGTVDTPSLRQRWTDSGDYETARRNFIARQPAGRLGKPEEIAQVALYLGSDAASFTTGQTFAIDGGMTI